jgi:plasmid stabilization system protein ParE
MIHKLQLKAHTEDDIAEAFDWYERQRHGLGLEFLDELDGNFEKIVKSPELYRQEDGLRISNMSRFPYKIIFSVESETVIVHAVYHDSRNPRTLIHRPR